jgi:ATP-dependent RNA circularization protein (DNA/RNA ligase family)
MSSSSTKTIPDIRKAYKKLFEDGDWAMSSRVVRKTIASLEYSFLKTHLKQRRYKSAFDAGFRMFVLRRY